MFADTALPKSVGSGTKQEENSLSLVLSPPSLLKSRAGAWGGQARRQTKSWQPGPVGPLEPACVLLEAFLFSLVPQTPVGWSLVRAGVGVERSWVRLGKKRRKW